VAVVVSVRSRWAKPVVMSVSRRIAIVPIVHTHTHTHIYTMRISPRIYGRGETRTCSRRITARHQSTGFRQQQLPHILELHMQSNEQTHILRGLAHSGFFISHDGTQSMQQSRQFFGASGGNDGDEGMQSAQVSDPENTHKHIHTHAHSHSHRMSRRTQYRIW
jgi:hypothetical protein